MSDAEALAEIKRLAGLGRIIYTKHARERMSDRGATRADVATALSSATEAVYQTDKQNFRVTGGKDTDGDALSVIVDLEADIVIVTVF